MDEPRTTGEVVLDSDDDDDRDGEGIPTADRGPVDESVGRRSGYRPSRHGTGR